MAILTEAFVEAMISDEVQEALFADDVGDAFFNVFVATADALVEAALKNAGYPAPVLASSPKAFALAQLAAFGEFIKLAYGRKQETVPEEYSTAVSLLKRIIEGELPMPDLAPAVPDAVGGVLFTESDPSVEDDEAAPQIFSRRALSET